MSKLKIGSITAIVNGYKTNNAFPYFQKAVPDSQRGRLGKATIKIALKAENCISQFSATGVCAKLAFE